MKRYSACSSNTTRTYGWVSRVLHWTSVLLVMFILLDISGLDVPPSSRCATAWSRVTRCWVRCCSPSCWRACLAADQPEPGRRLRPAGLASHARDLGSSGVVRTGHRPVRERPGGARPCRGRARRDRARPARRARPAPAVAGCRACAEGDLQPGARYGRGSQRPQRLSFTETGRLGIMGARRCAGSSAMQRGVSDDARDRVRPAHAGSATHAAYGRQVQHGKPRARAGWCNTALAACGGLLLLLGSASAPGDAGPRPHRAHRRG